MKELALSALNMLTQRQVVMRKYKREWARNDRAIHPDKYLKNDRRYKRAHGDELRERSRKYEAKNREKRKAKSLAYFYANRARLIQANKDYCKRTAARRLEVKRAIAARDRRLKNNAYFSNLLRNSLLQALNGKKKLTSAMTLLGCPLDLFRLHLQNQFRDGMDWNNHGKVWHIDHIQPCDSFDLSNPIEQAACFHYSNMQPLLAAENLLKGNRIPT